MNWFEAQMAASSFAKGYGGMSRGQRWGLAAMLHDSAKSESKPRPESSKKSSSGGHSKEMLVFLRVISLSLAAVAAVLWLAVLLIK